MKIEAENSGPKHLFGFEGIPVYWGSSFEGFHCTPKDQLTILLGELFETEQILER